MDIIKNNTIKAVYGDDLDNVLKNLGKYEPFIEGKCTCFFCKKTLNKDNLFAMLPAHGCIEMCCYSIKCIDDLQKL